MEDIPEIPPSQDSYTEQFIAGIFERNPDALKEKEKYKIFLNSNSFDGEVLQKSINRWNEKNKFEGQHSDIETVTSKNGQLQVIYYKGSDSIRFFYKAA